jgi:hypothetical protein
MNARAFMFKIRRSRDVSEVRFCDRCLEVCDRRCDAETLRRQTLDRALLYGWRPA